MRSEDVDDEYEDEDEGFDRKLLGHLSRDGL